MLVDDEEKELMRKLLYLTLIVTLAATAFGCAITNYPIIFDDRGDYSGIVRTGHKAYVVPTGQVATIYSDGSDELFTLVYQNQYGDQKLYTFNNFDPTAAVNFLDQTYCDWRYDGCEITRAWNPHQNNGQDDPFDYEFFPECSGARSLSVLVDQGSRLGECGDSLFDKNSQDLAAEFANLAVTTFRGEEAYVVPFSAATTSVTLTAQNGVTTTMPILGQVNGIITHDLNLVVPMVPNVRHNMQWLSNFVAQNGDRVGLAIQYGSLSGDADVRIAEEGVNYNLGRF
jgi:hypothetical protein